MNSGPQLYLNCEWCHEFFEYNGGKRKRFCSDAHKQAAWRAAQPIVDLGVLGKVRGIPMKITSVEPVQLGHEESA